MLVFTWLSIQQVDNEHALTREGQVTDRYNAAVGNIGEDALEVRLGGIYALQRIMQDSSRDQPSIVDVLSTYIRNHAKKPNQSQSGSSRPVTSKRPSLHSGTATPLTTAAPSWTCTKRSCAERTYPRRTCAARI